MKILHISGDEKFIDQAIRQFEAVRPGENECAVITSGSSLRHVRNPFAYKVSTAPFSRSLLRGKLRSADLVVLHSLTPALCQVCRWIPEEIPLLWLGFGFDYYDLIDSRVEATLGPLTACFSTQQRSGLRKWLHDWKMSRRALIKEKAIKRISYFAPVIPDEYEMILKSRPDFSPRPIIWSYLNVEEASGGFKPELKPDADDILVGNSSSLSNNHLETIEILRKNSQWESRRVIMPLSYGNADYRSAVIAHGEKYLVNRFYPLTEFLRLNEYAEILSGCRTVIFNHLRQQAVGNLVILLQQGSCVFMNQKSPVYSLLFREGAAVFPISELEVDPKAINRRLTPEQIEKNRAVISLHWGKHRVLDKADKMIRIILGVSRSDIKDKQKGNCP